MLKPILKLITILCFASILFAGAYDLFENAFSIDIPDTNHLNRSYADYTVSHQELYNASRNDTLLSRYFYNSQHLSFNYALSDKTSLFAELDRNTLAMDDLFNGDYTQASFKPIRHDLHLQLDSKINNWNIKPGIAYSFSSLRDTLFITDYPTSKQSALNTYFFNLLPDTYGDSIHFANSYRSIQGDLFAHNNKLAFYLSYRFNSEKITETHVNSNPDKDLQGPRESVCSLNNMNVKAKLGWMINDNHYIWGGIDYRSMPLDWHHTIYPGDPTPADIIQLAWGQNSLFQGQLGYKTYVNKFDIRSTLSGGFANVADTARTPVLGYFLNIFPISHQANLNTSSAYLMGTIHADYTWELNGFTLKPRLDILASRFWANVDMEALLEFGLEDYQVIGDYVHVLYLAAIGCDSYIYINQNVLFHLDIEQLLPYVKQVSPEPPVSPPDGITRYGGLSLNAGLSFTW